MTGQQAARFTTTSVNVRTKQLRAAKAIGRKQVRPISCIPYAHTSYVVLEVPADRCHMRDACPVLQVQRTSTERIVSVRASAAQAQGRPAERYFTRDRRPVILCDGVCNLCVLRSY